MGEVKKIKDISLRDIEIKDGFWTNYINLVKNVVIPYQWQALNDEIEGAEPSHCIKNFKIAAGEEKGEFNGHSFQDTDLYKWIEAASYILAAYPDPELEKTIDEAIDLIGKAQQPDGYLDTYYIIMEPENRWTNELAKHELYCAGHMIEAAVAYYEATGKEKLLNIACRFADHIDEVFGKEENKLPGYSGHQEIELALMRLYRAKGNEKYLNLSKYFIDERGQEPNYFNLEAEKRAERIGKEAVLKEHYYMLVQDGYKYMQAHVPVRQQNKAVGHAVRAMYMYTAMADLAGEIKDEALFNACKILWENVTESQLYITGGIGSSDYGEKFTFDYDLPNDTAYAETCASVGLVFWSQKMFGIDQDSKYADIMEKALYNGTISGMSLDGKSFFYVNPLEVWPEACENRQDLMHVEPVRQKWFGCACCPPNIARLIASIGKYIYSQQEDKIYVHHYIGSDAKFNVGNANIKLTQESNYPWQGNIKFLVTVENPVKFTMALRIPEWCSNAAVKVNGNILTMDIITKKGYAEVEAIWCNGDVIEITLPMTVEKLQANPNLRKNTGKVALQRGPIVYCLEEVDNGADLADISLPRDCSLQAEYDSNLLDGVTMITGEALRSHMSDWKGKLYKRAEYNTVPIKIKAIPYYAWANRTPGEMIVWIREC
ncbi:glycoside hydrolase family 127 protein [Alkaliphilus peptidifermentans]|uniref:Glycoside hydrolase family 127 protein n=1 Tax=Alkaliphilus peptidifermentans DSM 18978 TaxID=1120976 RepID=A0A1G5IU56_9FIRM|nr:beta-L-arabinofuranosidase domain-containing protein [Alkaliphilus peptidifermentans]SCY79179.1 hypothetical protein SAMN03080606_02504 [Alkaliphilus peptidifermentans DSM 18978]